MEGNEDELDIKPLEFDAREGTAKLSVDDILGIKKETTEEKTESEPSKEGETKEETKEKTQKEVFAEVKALVYSFNFAVVVGSGLIAKAFGKEINTENINASDSEINRLAKVAQPVYEKYLLQTASPETVLVIAILSIYGFRIAGEFLGAQDLAERTSKETQKTATKAPTGDFWKGDKRYYQTGEKAGTLKPSRR